MISYNKGKRYIDIITTKNTIGDIMYRKGEERERKDGKKRMTYIYEIM